MGDLRPSLLVSGLMVLAAFTLVAGTVEATMAMSAVDAAMAIPSVRPAMNTSAVERAMDFSPPGLMRSEWAIRPVLQGAQEEPFGDSAQRAERLLSRELALKTAVYFTCFGFYLLVGIIFLIFWRWTSRDLPILSVSLISLVMAVHTATVSTSLHYMFPTAIDPGTNEFVEAVSYLLLNGFIAFMLWAFFPDAFRPVRSHWVRTLNSVIGSAAAISSVFLAAAVMVSGDPNTRLILSISRWITVMLMVVVVALALQTIERREPNGAVTAVGLAMLVVGSLHDVLFAGVGETGRPYLITFAFLGFVLLQSYVVMRRSAESTQMARINSRRLRREVEARTKELRAASVAAQAANMAKTEFVTAVTHELRTPLTSMLGYLQLLREELVGKLDEEQLEFFETLNASGERLLNLVNNLLDLAKIESGRIELRLERLDIRRIIEEVSNELYPLANRKGLSLETEIELSDGTVLADEQWLGLVITNLVSNAVKYTIKGGVTINVISSRMGRKNAVAVTVVDTGPGISSEFMPRLFERFTREDHARIDVPTGSGLGLTIARELLTLMGGEIFVESQVGVGSSFTILLPVPEPPPPPEE